MNIYVGNLSLDITEEELKEAFGAFGEVIFTKIIKDRFTGESRGFGFVEMSNDEEAEKAISELNGQDLKGRALKVNKANPRPEGGGRGPRRDGGSNGGGRGPRREGGFGGSRNGSGGGRGRY